MKQTTAIERAERDLAKAKRELEIAAMLPEIDGFEPLIVQHRAHVSLIYKDPQTFADILRIFDAYTAAPVFVVKEQGWAAKVARAELDNAETIVSDAYAWVKFGASINIRGRADFCILATLEDGTPAEVQVAVEQGHWNRGARHADLWASFSCDNPRRQPQNRTYRATAPAFLATCAYVWRWATGARDGSEFAAAGVFMTRDCLASALETLEA